MRCEVGGIVSDAEYAIADTITDAGGEPKQPKQPHPALLLSGRLPDRSGAANCWSSSLFVLICSSFSKLFLHCLFGCKYATVPQN